MASKKRPIYTAEDRAKVLKMLADKVSVADICRQTGISEPTITNWRKAAAAKAPVARPAPAPAHSTSALETRIRELEAEIRRKDATIVRLVEKMGL